MAKKLEYFPRLGPQKGEVLSESRREHYSEILAEFKEPSLWELREDVCAEAYRFLWLRTFHPAICIRIDIIAKEVGNLTKKMGTGECGFGGVGPLTLNEQKHMTKQETAKFMARVAFSNLWGEPTSEDRDGLDGASWIFEAVKEGNYHVVDRWCPEKSPVRTIGLEMMIKLADLKLLYQEVY